MTNMNCNKQITLGCDNCKAEQCPINLKRKLNKNLNLKNAKRISDKSKWEELTGFSELGPDAEAIHVFECGCWFEEFKDGDFMVTIGNDGIIDKDINKIVKYLNSNWHKHEHQDS